MNQQSKVIQQEFKNYFRTFQLETMTKKTNKEWLWAFSVLIFSFFITQNAQATQPLKTLPSTVQSDDHLIVVKNHKLIFDIFKKSQTSEDIVVLTAPEYGKVFISGQDSMTYIPQADICEQSDYFSYRLKTDNGFDTIDVTIEILCETLTIVSGFSPNGDGVNDNFTILGVQNFPNNSILIFNKWGEKIFQQKGYENNWGGEKDHGDSLPAEESLYYYVFEDGEGQSYSGYVKIMDSI